MEHEDKDGNGQSLDKDEDTEGLDKGQDDEGLDKEVLTERVLVDKPAILNLFRVCSIQGCGAPIDPEDVIAHTDGAAMTVKATCLENHEISWKSCNTVGEGHSKIFVVNILLSAYTLFCGLNISQVG